MNPFHFECHHAYPDGFEIDVQFVTSNLVTSIFGPSGSGKTSVLEMIAGLKRPKHGKIVLNKRPLLDTQQNIFIPLQQRHIGMVFQDHLLFPHMNIEKNLQYGQKRRSGDTHISFDRVVNVLDLNPLLKRTPKTLSGGERQRVALGRAMLSAPELLLMDEPLSALDDVLKSRILAYIERVVNEWNIPTLLVSHSQLEVQRLSSWVIILDQGKVITEGTPEEALHQPEAMKWKNAMGPINLLRIEELQQRDGVWMGRIGKQFLQLPPHEHKLAMPLFVQFHPQSVIVSREDIPNISARNHLKGTLRKIIEVQGACFLAIDTGQILWSEVTPQAIQDLGLEVGSEATCLIKTHSLEIVE